MTLAGILPCPARAMQIQSRLLKMVKDHTQTSVEFKSLAREQKGEAELPTALNSEHVKKFDKLKAKLGKDFDTAYDRMHLQAHGCCPILNSTRATETVPAKQLS